MHKLWSQCPLSMCCWFKVQIGGYLSWKGCTESGVGWGASRAAQQRQSPRVLVQNGNTQQKRMRVGKDGVGSSGSG